MAHWSKESAERAVAVLSDIHPGSTWVISEAPDAVYATMMAYEVEPLNEIAIECLAAIYRRLDSEGSIEP